MKTDALQVHVIKVENIDDLAAKQQAWINEHPDMHIKKDRTLLYGDTVYVTFYCRPDKSKRTS